MSFRTFFPKTSDLKFVVKNIAPNGKRVKAFNYPISNGLTRDLLSIPEVSEEVIRHSMLKGELLVKFRNRELTVVFSNIDLTQYTSEYRQTLISYGIVNGLGIDFTLLDQPGQVLYSLDGETFTAQLPLTSDGGWVVNDDGLLVVVG